MITSLGLTQQDVGAALGGALGGGYVNYFSISGRSYRVIPQVLQVDRLNPDQVLDYYINTPERPGDPGLDGGHDQARGGAALAQPLPAAELGDHLRRVRACRRAMR